MLAPNGRELLLDALRPDPGYRLEHAVGTTYSLDLDALLMAPLAFALFDVDTGAAGADPIALLATIKSYADRMAIYVDGSRIYVPAAGRPLMQLLESTIKPVHTTSGVFHPKVWVLRYRSPEGERRHRALVLSRNLTFDRSWDTILRLDEDIDRAAGENALELASFLRELNRRTPSDVVAELLRSLPSVSFAPPRGFDDLRFWSLHDGRPDPMADVEASSALVISPFATAGRLARMAPGAKRRALVTRPDTLDDLGGNALKPWHEVYILRSEVIEDDETAKLSGLHAKVHVFDDGTRRRIFTGSANATTAAFSDNVELLVELTSTDPATRIDRLLADSDREPTLRALLVPRRPGDAEPRQKTAREVEEERLQRLAKTLAAQLCVARAVPDDDGRWTVELRLPVADAQMLSSDALRARLITAGGTWHRLDCDDGSARGVLRAGGASKVTSLIAVELSGDPALGASPETFVIVAELRDAPEDRERQLLLDLLPDAQKLMRLLFLLLADAREGADAAGQVRKILTASTSGGGGDGWAHELPLFENLVRTFAREPHRLRGIRSVIDQLRTADDGRERFPPGFLELWAVFDAALPTEPKW